MNYLLQNLHQQYIGNSPMFWKKGGSGYTQWIDEAEIFDEETANRYLREDGSKWQIWPIEEIVNNSKRTVDIQDLRKLKDCNHKKRYIPDPSGNNDWYYECEKCGKDLGKMK